MGKIQAILNKNTYYQKERKQNIYVISWTHVARKPLGFTEVQGKYTPPPTLYLDKKIEWKTSPALEMIHIILKHKLQRSSLLQSTFEVHVVIDYIKK